MEKIAQYKQLLAGLDWYYAFSDDYSAYGRGSRANGEILRMSREVDPNYVIFNQYAPDSMKKSGAAAA